MVNETPAVKAGMQTNAMYFEVERNTGIGPVSQPWQGRVLPLYQFRISVRDERYIKKQSLSR
jgi:hypothetical protein